MTSSTNPPWSLKTIVLISVLFSPIVGAIMAHVNSTRAQGYRTPIKTYLLSGLALFGIVNVFAFAVLHNDLSIRQSGIPIVLLSVALIVHIYRRQAEILHKHICHRVEFAPWYSAISYAITLDIALWVTFFVAQAILLAVVTP